MHFIGHQFWAEHNEKYPGESKFKFEDGIRWIMRDFKTWIAEEDTRYHAANIPDPEYFVFGKGTRGKAQPYDSRSARWNSAISFTKRTSMVPGSQTLVQEAAVQIWFGSEAERLPDGLVGVKPSKTINLVLDDDGFWIQSSREWDPFSDGRWALLPPKIQHKE